MSFSRVNSGGWAVGDKLTSAQMNALDVDHANALDKTTAGDQLAGVVTMAATASLRASNAGATIRADVAGGILATVAGGITATVAGGITPGVNAGITSGVAGGITSTIANGIVSNVAGGIQSLVAGGFALSGGSTDWIKLTGGRTRSPVRPLRPLVALATGWKAQAAGPGLLGPALAGPTNLQECELLVHDGATLSAVYVMMYVAGPHSGGVPATFPSLSVRRYPFGASAGFSQYLSTTIVQYATAASGSAWDNGGASQLLTYTCNQNNVVDTTNYFYTIEIADENGSNSVANNLYVGVQCLFTAIGDTRFQ